MRKSLIVRLLTVVCITWLWVACNRQNTDKELLASKIQYDVPVASADNQLDWWINNLEGSKREPFLKRIMDAAEKGEVKVFDYFGNPLNPDQIASSCSDTIYQTLLRSYPPYEEFDTMIVKTISFRDIQKIRFLEEWTWDPKDLDIRKKVLGFGPVIQRQFNGQVFNQLLFWIFLDDNYMKQEGRQ